MKFFSIATLCIVTLLSMPSKAMEDNNISNACEELLLKQHQEEQMLDTLTEEEDMLQQKLSAIFDDPVQSGAIFMALFQKTTRNKPLPAAFNQMVCTWKAIPIARRLLQIKKQQNQLEGINTAEDTQMPEKIELLQKMHQDSHYYISTLPNEVVTKVQTLLDKDVMHSTVECFAENMGVDLGKWIQDVVVPTFVIPHQEYQQHIREMYQQKGEEIIENLDQHINEWLTQ